MISFTKRVLNHFFLINKFDLEHSKKKKILNILLLGFEIIDSCIILIYLVFLIFNNPIEGIRKTLYLLIISNIAFFGGIFIFLINNYVSDKLASIIFLIFITVLIIITDTPYELVLGRSLLILTLPIFIAGFLIKPYFSFIMSFFIIILNLIICFIEGFFPNFIGLTIFILIAFVTWFSGLNFEKSIEKYYKAFKQENFYKDLFVHDTNNYLQNIIIALELFELELKNSGVFIESDLLKQVKVQIERAVNLIRNVRKFGTISESKINLKKLDFKKVLEEVINTIKKNIERKELNVQIETLVQDTSVKANKFLFDIIENIIFNSVIHNDNFNVEILVRISTIKTDKRPFLKIEFIDNGIGIPDSIKQNIFDRGIDRDKSLIGLGIGLSIVKRILTQYKAKIWVENKIPEDYSKGSNFIILFPKMD